MIDKGQDINVRHTHTRTHTQSTVYTSGLLHWSTYLVVASSQYFAYPSLIENILPLLGIVMLGSVNTNSPTACKQQQQQQQQHHEIHISTQCSHSQGLG